MNPSPDQIARLPWAARLMPAPLFRLAAEFSGKCSIFQSGWYLAKYPDAARYAAGPFLHYLRRGMVANCSPHPAFDAGYYLKMNPDIADSRWHPFLHFIAHGGSEGRSPHWLFDSRWYLEKYPEVAALGFNPLQHYVRFGWQERRQPHALFDPGFYLARYDDITAAGLDPLSHFIEYGGREGRDPHPLFDSAFYLTEYPDVASYGLNPLIHYLEHGAREGRDPHPLFSTRYYLSHPGTLESGLNPLEHFVVCGARLGYDPHPSFHIQHYLTSNPDAAASGLNPLVHYVAIGAEQGVYIEPPGPGDAPSPVPEPPAERAAPLAPAGPLTLDGAGAPESSQPWRNGLCEPDTDVPVLIVYGAPNVRFLTEMVLPALRAQAVPAKLSVHLVNYREPVSLLTADAISPGGAVTAVHEWSAARPEGHWGFGEGINYLFEQAQPPECFFVVNPDSFPMPGCLAKLLRTYSDKNAAFVEARQWPQEHPKEYDNETGATPWASGAFLVASAEAFRRLGGFDPIYFLYNEDVDLSWRAWLNDMPVYYEPGAMCAHFTGLLSYRRDRFYYEHFYSLRNFVVIAYKFFGEEGEARALEWLDGVAAPIEFKAAIRRSYADIRPGIRRYLQRGGSHTGKIKILGLNVYHELRRA